MQCNVCKKEIAEKYVFCPNCGNQLKSNIVQSNTNIVNKTVDNLNKNKSKKKKKHPFLKFLLILIISIFLLFLIVKGINAYRKTLDNIYITNSEVYGKKDNADFYKIDKKIDKINLKIKTFKKVKKTKITLKSNNLTLFQKDYTKDKKYSIKEISLPLGTSELNVEVTLDNDKVISRVIVIYNVSKDNLGNLDIKDSDNDKLLNYEEDIYATNKYKSDSDSDGLTDYEEIVYTLTSPTNYYSLKKDISDANADSDLDGLSNIEEITLGTKPQNIDSDGDYLTDYEEVKIYSTNPMKYDSDSDGVSDYDEVKNYYTNPNSMTEIFSGKVESDNKEVGITLNNLKKEDIELVTFDYTNEYILNENMAGYIMPAYDIKTSISFDTTDIVFNFADYKINEDAIPTIYYFNENTRLLEELPTVIENKTAKTTVNHLSTYVLLDKRKFESINQVDINSKTIQIKENINGEFTFFYSPLLANILNQPIEIYCGPSLTEEQIEIIEKKFANILGTENKVIIKRYDEQKGFDFTKNFFDGVYEALSGFMKLMELDDLLYTEKTNSDSYIHDVGGVISVGYISNINDLSTLMLESKDESIFTDNYVLVDLEDQTDTNNDGISDSFTKAILAGEIVTTTGINPFSYYTWDDIMNNDDLDQDGLKNGEEIIIRKLDNKYYAEMKSDMTLKDTDNDGYEDKVDPLPLYGSHFAITDSLQEKVDTRWLEDEVDNYNKLFGKGKFIYELTGTKVEYLDENGNIKYSPNRFDIVGSTVYAGMTAAVNAAELASAGDAKQAYSFYFNAANYNFPFVYTEKNLVELSLNKDGSINKNSIYGSEDTQALIYQNIDKIKYFAENVISSGQTKVIKNTQAFRGTASYGIGDYDQNTNVLGFLHNSSAKIIAEISNNDNNYTMKLRYFILDIYDWKNSEECDINSAACPTEVILYNKMLVGQAKGYLVRIEYDMEVTWKKGMSPSVKLLNGTPYA